jgi:hypothetical protein
MSRRLKSVAAGLVVTGSLAGAALAQAATSTTPTTPAKPSAPPAGKSAPDGGRPHHGDKGDCPGMGGDSSSSAPSSSAPSTTGTGSV